MEILCLANGAFAVPTLAALHRAGHALDLVVPPDPPRRRRGQAVVSPVVRWANENGVPCRPIDDLKNSKFLAAVRAKNFEIGFTVDYGKKVPRALFEIPKAGIWNLHPSLLPKHRGAAPIPWTLANGDRQTGVTLFRIVEKMDAGPILLWRSEGIRADDDAPALQARLAKAAAALALEGLAALGAGTLKEIPQDEAGATVARKLVKADGRIDWGKPAEAIARQVRAFKPWPGTWTEWNHPKRGKMLLMVEEAALVLDREGREEERKGKAPGEVCVEKGRIRVAAGKGELEILRLRPEGGTLLTAAEFLRGYPLADGDSMGS